MKMKNILAALLLLFLTSVFAQNERVFTGKCAISQTGGGSGFWQVSITNFNDPGGQFTSEDITSADFLFFSDSGTPYSLDVTEVVSASGASATIKVSNVGITGISSVPTTNSSFVSRTTVNYNLFPWVANIPANENQLQGEYLVYLIDSLLNISGGGGGITAINSQTRPTQTMSVGTSGNDFSIQSGGNIHVFQMPSASATARGLVTTGGQTIAGQKTLTSTPIITPLTASLPVRTNGSKELVSGLIDLTTDITGVLPAGNVADAYWTKTTDQLGLSGTKQTTGVVAGSGPLLTNQKWGSTSQILEAYKCGNVALPAESVYQDWDGLVRMYFSANSSGTTAEIREVATGSDATSKGGSFTSYIRAAGASKNAVLNMTRGTYAADLPYVNIGSAGLSSAFFNATYNAALNVPATGVAIEGPVSYLFTTLGGASGEDLRIVQKTPSTYTTTASIDATTNGWNAGSDARLKDGIEKVAFSPEDIRNLGMYEFDWKHSGRHDISVVAQELLKHRWLKYTVRGTESDGYTVNPLGVASAGLEASRALQLQFDALLAKVSELEARIAELEK